MATKTIEQTINITDYMDNAATTYASEANVFRAIPDLRDGLKPVHRDIVYGLGELGFTSTKPHKKSNKSVGHIMGAYYSHGDASIYKSMIRLSQSWVNNLKLTDVHGNNGSIEGEECGAMRYTETRLSLYGEMLLDNLQKNAVPFIPNFDNTTEKPRILPAKYPVALINGAVGIGWGLASNILPHNPIEMMDGAIAIVKNPTITPQEMMTIIKGPDSPTGCQFIVSEDELLKEMTNGNAKYKMRSNINIEWSKDQPKLVITSLPLNQVFDDTFVNKIADIAETAKGFGIRNLENDIDQKQFKVSIICEPGTTETQLEQLKAYLYKKTNFETTFTTNNLMLDHGRPKSLGILPYLKKFLQFRRETLRRIWQFDMDKANARLEIVNGLLKIQDILDDVIKVARESSSEEDLIKKLVEKFDLSEVQAKHIANLRIYRLNNQNFTALANEKDELLGKVSEFTEKLTNKAVEDKELLADLKETRSKLKQFKRKSELVNSDTVQEYVEIKAEDLIKPTPTKVIIKKDLQMFMIGRTAYKNQIENYKDNDIVAAIDAQTTDYVVAITDTGQTVTRFVHDLQSLKLDGKAKRLNEEIKDLKGNNEFVGGLVMDKDDTSQRFIMLTAEGNLKTGIITNVLPKVSNKGYMKRLGKGIKLKNDTDKIVLVTQLPEAEFATKELVVLLADTSKKSGQVTRKLPLEKIVEFNDSASNSGRNKINTKKGQLGFISAEFVDISPSASEETDETVEVTA